MTASSSPKGRSVAHPAVITISAAKTVSILQLHLMIHLHDVDVPQYDCPETRYLSLTMSSASAGIILKDLFGVNRLKC
jgi:hypothetical protein